MLDVIVIGGGPAGSTAASLLHDSGAQVALFERERFPRFHIGESLLPIDLSILERLGFDAQALPAVHKLGADFLHEGAGKCGRFAFSEGLEGTPGHAWQVDRASFDAALLELARKRGVEVYEETSVDAVRVFEDRVEVDAAARTYTARYVVDATGRDRLMSKLKRSYERIEGFGLAAVWDHFEGLSDEADTQLQETGNIVVLMLDKGWGWVIPLPGKKMSLGFVSAERGIVSEDWFEAELAGSAFLQRLTAGASRSGTRLTGDFSYRNTSAFGARYGCIGDAGGFLDPVFSSGVTLAICGGEKLADIVGPALKQGREGEEDLLAPLKADIEHAHEVFTALIRSFYQTNFVDNLFFYDDPDPGLRAGLISILAGDVWRDDNPFQGMLLRRAKRHKRQRVSTP